MSESGSGHSGRGRDERAVERLQALLRVPTVSVDTASIGEDDGCSPEWFEPFTRVLAEQYPAAHDALEVERIAGRALLARWPGRSPGDPVLLTAHLDVVPVAGQDWTHPPFAAQLDDDDSAPAVWARDALDDKGALAAILEAIERAIEAGTTPAQDVLLCFGADEELTGTGAAAVAALLRERGIRPRLVLDEGGAVVRGVLPGVAGPLAVVGVSEKGIATLRLTVDEPGGHAATPPRITAPARLARALTRLRARPFPARLGSVERAMLHAVAERARPPYRAVYANARAFAPALARILAALGGETAALVHTTLAVTRLSGSDADNVLATRATATLNLRIAVGSSVADAVAHVRRTVRDGRVRLEVVHASEPSRVSRTDGDGWALLSRAIRATFPDAIITPYTMLQASDSRHFAPDSDAVYRFLPFELTREDRGRIHGPDERIRLSTFRNAVDFFERLVADLSRT